MESIVFYDIRGVILFTKLSKSTGTTTTQSKSGGLIVSKNYIIHFLTCRHGQVMHEQSCCSCQDKD